MRGHTLFEAVTVLGILAGALGMAGPALGSMLASARLGAGSEMMLANLQLARGEAIKRNARVVVCPSADGLTCSSSIDWENGAIVFQDTNNNGARDPAEPLVSHQQPLPPGTHVSGNSTLGSYVSYAPDGQARHVGSGAFEAGTLTLCHPGAAPSEARQIVINSGGRPRTQKLVVPQCS